MLLPDVGLALRTQMAELPRWLLRHGRDGVMVCFAALALAAIAFVYWFLPEIKGLPIEEIVRVFERQHGTIPPATAVPILPCTTCLIWSGRSWRTGPPRAALGQARDASPPTWRGSKPCWGARTPRAWHARTPWTHDAARRTGTVAATTR